MARFSHRKNKMMSEINVVPYIDVMLVLLIIFMVTTPLLTKGIKVDLPKTTTKPVKIPKLDNFVVTIKKGNGGTIKLYLDDRPISRRDLGTKLKKVLRIQPKTPILVRGDRRVAYGKVVELMSLLQKAGAPSVGLVTQPVN
ncbi:MAG TPA: protein TolR [Acidiferrobacteraceae bacterium]|jgi:biopolymer transport protein TolR|nr:protein TolR [Acidiferrobacteraceae bacterium]HEX20118.1 protein TolR [Acidiferrobacteraceae bacterium]